MKKVALFVSLVFLFISGDISAQLCGGGILQFYILTLNGSEPIDFEYELFTASDSLVQKKVYDVLDKYSIERYERAFNETGFEIAKQTAEEISNPQDEKRTIQLDKFIANSGLSRKGKVKELLEFKTYELVGTPVILKISAKGKSIYILGNFFGNCDRISTLLWTDRFRWIR
ncbi:hypothetical protein [Flavobacterium silvaticum]|uniref:Uncharacterized protein n=1 Tax=Flavobacterium silvaticum TaxID=1852020 RepID=A0A972JEF2_9FLAO|nr:hypothetical protein [Flavobacterium silvaticum]NMH26819.1 hypothetical protein [Flavobacterium silvaticum]